MSTAPETAAESLKDFLRAKADEYGVRDRLRRRKEWLDAVKRLYDQLKTWMREADPEGLLDVVPYEVQRTEQGFGTYDAPALLVRFGPAEADVKPIQGVIQPRYLFPIGQGARGLGLESELPKDGRIDVTNGLNTYHLLRQCEGGGDAWWIWDGATLSRLGRMEFERILKELLS